MTEVTSPDNGSDLSTAADKIAGLLGRETPTPDADGDDLPQTDEVETAQEDEPSESEGTDDEGQDTEAQEDSPQPKRKLKVGDQELDEDEVVNGYLRQSDYTRKTQAAAEQRKAAEAELRAVAEERQRYAQTLEYFSQQLPQAAPPSPDLLDSDPVEYLKQRDAFERSAAQRNMAAAELQRVHEQQRQDAQRRFIEVRQAEEQALVEKLPEWREEAKAKEGKAQVAKYLKDAGYSDEQLSTLVDHRSVIIARKAMLYDQMVARKPAVENKVRNAPPVLKPGVAKQGNGEAERALAARDRLKKTGRVEDAAAAINALMRRK